MKPLKKIIQNAVAFILLLVVMLFRSGPLAAEPLSARKLALLVGINKYKSMKISTLKGCVNDVEMMKTLLIGKFDFPEQNIMTLTDKQATRAGILSALEDHLINKAAPGAIVVFHFSGHGSQMKDVSGDEMDGMDETIVPYDSRQGNIFDISDDEINTLFERLSKKTSNITFIFDSCHSGTVTRTAGAARDIPADKRTPPPSPIAAGSRGTGQSESETNNFKGKNVNFVLITGCRPEEKSFEYKSETERHGTLTYFFTQELQKAKAGATYRDIMDNVVGLVNAARPGQHPTFEGTSKDFAVFGDKESLPQSYIQASPKGESSVKLHAGKVQGLTAGSVFEVYPPGTKRFEPPARPIAKIRLSEVKATEATGKIISGSKIQIGSRAIEREHSYSDLKMTVYFQGIEQSSVLQAIKGKIAGFHHIKTVAAARDYNILLRQSGNQIMTEGADPTEISPRLSVNDPNVVTKLVTRLTDWAKWFNLLAISNNTPPFEIDFGVNAVGRSEDSNIYESEEDFECVVQNKSDKALYIAILDLSTDGSVAVIYPDPPGAVEKLAPGATLKETFETFMPDDRESVTDYLKVFATREPVDFTFLSQGSIRGSASKDPLSQLLQQAGLGSTRGSKSVKQNWVEAQRVITIVRDRTTVK